MTTMRVMHAGGGEPPARTVGRVGIWLAALAAALTLLWAPFAAGDRAIMQWSWPLGGILLVLAVRGLGMAAGREMGEHEHPREDSVGRWLERLGGKAHVLRYVTVGGRSIEYVVVSQAGVFAIRTRTHRGKLAERGGELMLNGRQLSPDVLASSRSEAKALQDRLGALGFGYPVQPLVVFTDAHTDVHRVAGVTALPLRWLESFIRRSPGMMSSVESTLVAGALRRDARATITR